MRLECRVSAAAVVLLGACSVGQGEGLVTGAVFAESCNLDRSDFEFRPSFFAAEEIEGGQLEIRIQRGSNDPLFSDGMIFSLSDVNLIKEELLGQPIDLTSSIEDEAQNELIVASLYLNERCDPEPDGIPVVFVAESGTMSFRSVYAPDIDRREREISASFENMRMVDPSRPDTREATLNGEFRFLYTTGRPAQSFP